MHLEHMVLMKMSHLKHCIGLGIWPGDPPPGLICLNLAPQSLLMLHVQTGFGYFAIVVAVVAMENSLGND